MAIKIYVISKIEIPYVYQVYHYQVYRRYICKAVNICRFFYLPCIWVTRQSTAKVTSAIFILETWDFEHCTYECFKLKTAFIPMTLLIKYLVTYKPSDLKNFWIIIKILLIVSFSCDDVATLLMKSYSVNQLNADKHCNFRRIIKNFCLVAKCHNN